ncbi:MAG: LicD family protein [Aeriscardovia sp.]|nr:LicD family protein [Aeriscardovia sp.]MBR3462032.1 LicD family protein [Clostridiales bacterium]
MIKGSGIVTGEDLKRLQGIQLELMSEFDRVCRKHDIKYTITCGTLLGAIRHKGFIPWDNDADISMLREDYEKFKQVADEMDPSICFFQDHDTDPDYLWGYGKVRKTGTTFVREGQGHIHCKTGVYIDIMPADDIPKSAIGQEINNLKWTFLRKILWARVAVANSNQLRWKILNKIPVSVVYKALAKAAKKSSNSSDKPVRVLTLPSGGKERSKLYHEGKNDVSLKYGVPKAWHLELAEYDFEDRKFFGTKDYDGYLTSRYGDYMKLPPEDKRTPKDPAEEWEF